MNKTVLKFGLIAGGLMSAMMSVSAAVGFKGGAVVGYTTMVLAFLFVFFGIRSYRDTIGAGSVAFGRALAIGTLIAVVASACYTATWEVIYYWVAPDFAAKYEEYEVGKVQASGASTAETAKQIAHVHHLMQAYRNPLVNIAMTMLEPLPVGLVMAFISAAMLRRREQDSPTRAPVAGAAT
ncbi:MAG TPA: DUF4199 domain-containing protein [Gemmatimonadaceae bacterium]|nr:DUF4199 domain-containing protein [Gemmatimonadaceae bacterium]